MNYNELTFLAKNKKITLAKLAEGIGLTRQGLQTGIERKTLTWEKIASLCTTLEITPNALFGWSEIEPGSQVATNIFGGHNEQNSNESIIALNGQLKEKDKQIDRLLKIIEANTLKR